MTKSSSGKDGYRSFTVINVMKGSGCNTKFNGGRYKAKKPVGAARKAFSEFCRTKRIRGVCTLVVVIKEMTRGSSGKTFAYRLKRNKLKDPIIRAPPGGKEYVIEYTTEAKSLKSIPTSCKDPDHKQSRGRRKTHTAKKYKLTANNVRKGRKRGSVKRREMFGGAEENEEESSGNKNSANKNNQKKDHTKGCRVKARVVEHYVLPSDLK